MNEFISQYGVCILLCVIGGFFVIMSYATYGTGSSPTPFIGGILIAIGFLTTPYKWLALLGLVDYATPMIIYSIYDSKKFDKVLKSFKERIATEFVATEDLPDELKKTTDRDSGTRLFVNIPDREEELEWFFYFNNVYRLRIPKVYFSICINKKSERILLVDRGDGHIEATSFEQDSITINGLMVKEKGKEKEIKVILSLGTTNE